MALLEITDKQKRPSLDRRLSIVKERLIGRNRRCISLEAYTRNTMVVHNVTLIRYIMITELRQEHSSPSQNLLVLPEFFCSVIMSQLCHSNQSLATPRTPLVTSVDSCKICADYISLKDNNGHHTTLCEFKIFTILPQLHVSHFISLSLTPVDCRSLMLEIKCRITETA